MEQYGNSNFNMERVLRENIVAHEYTRRTCREMSSWDAVIDEIYQTVSHVEPWMSGNVRGPSTAFCLLHRLFELKPTDDQIRETITCKDSPYVRAVGFLYLRYVGHPDSLLDWFQPYFADTQRFWPSGDGFGKEVTVGSYAIDLLLCQNYFETIFTRIPKRVGDGIVRVLQESGLPTEAVGNGAQGGPDRRGGDDGRARPASVKASLSVAMGQRAPNRAGVTEDASLRLSRREDMGARPTSGHTEQRGSHRDGRPQSGSSCYRRVNDDHSSPRQNGHTEGYDGYRSSIRGVLNRREQDRCNERLRDKEIHDSRPDRSRERAWDPSMSRERGDMRRRTPPRSNHTVDTGGRRNWRHSDVRRPPLESRNHVPASGVFGRTASDVFGTAEHRVAGPGVLAIDEDDLLPEEGFKIGRRR